MKEIYLRNGGVTLVDDEDYEYLNQFKWRALKSKNNKHVTYAIRDFYLGNRKCKGLLMHREIMKATKGEYIDHMDRDGLNNQKVNLRFCTMSENAANKKIQVGRKYKGVRKRYPFVKCKNKNGDIITYKRKDSYCAFVVKDKVNYYGGEYPTPEEAALAYNKMALELYGDFALLNVV